MLWIQRLENELVHHQCQCIDIIATVTKFSFEVLRNHKGCKSLELSHLGFTLVPTKWILKQSSNNLLRRKCFYVKGKLLPIWVSLWNVWWKFVVNVASSKTLCTFRKLSIDESLMKCYNYLMEFWIKMHKKNYHNSTQSSLTKNLFVFKRRLIKISVGRPMSHLKSITTQRADLSTPKKASQIHCPILKQQLQIAIDNDWTS